MGLLAREGMVRSWHIKMALAMPSWFGFLRIEADLAMTLVGVAKVLRNPENAAHSLGNARKALAEIQRGLMNPITRGLNENELLFLEQRCMEIESALATF